MSTRPATFADIKHELLSRRPETYHDHLCLRNTQLLSISLPGLDLERKNHYAHLLTSETLAVLPQGHHLLFFGSVHPTDFLLPDGTDLDHSPGPPFTRRVWAGGSVAFRQGWKSKLRIASNPWVCRESITDVRLKGVPSGHETSFEIAPGPGDKIFVDIERLYALRPRTHEEIDPAIVERRTLCFMTPKTADDIQRALKQPDTKTVKGRSTVTSTYLIPIALYAVYELKTNLDLPAPQLLPEESPSSYCKSFTLTPAALFRFSALTFNAHKIHLDTQYCREVEGYRDLLVHGPLLLMLMFSVLNNSGHIVISLDYQNLAPVYVGEEIKVCVQQRKDKWNVWIMGPHDDLRVKGTAVLDRDAEDGGLFRLTTEEQVR